MVKVDVQKRKMADAEPPYIILTASDDLGWIFTHRFYVDLDERFVLVTFQDADGYIDYYKVDVNPRDIVKEEVLSSVEDEIRSTAEWVLPHLTFTIIVNDNDKRLFEIAEELKVEIEKIIEKYE